MSDDDWLRSALDDYHRREDARSAQIDARVQVLLDAGITVRQLRVVRELMETVVLERDQQWIRLIERRNPPRKPTPTGAQA